MLTVIIFILVLSLLVFVHELGHFITAKRAGARIDEFSIGFPPRLWSTHKDGTRYSIGAIPFGGYVKIFGEDEAQKDEPGAFGTLSVGKRAWVLTAGVLMNLLLAVVLMAFVSALGQPTTVTDANIHNAKDVAITVLQVGPNSPADEAGIKLGDEIVRAQVGEKSIATRTDVAALSAFLRDHQGQETTLTLQRGEEILTITTTLRENPTHSEGALGVALAPVGIVQTPVWQAPWEGVKNTALMGVAMVGALQQIGGNISEGRGLEGLAGPVGIATLTGDAARMGFIFLLQFTAFLSLNLAILNILPFPALDGGRLVFLAVEKVKGRPVTPKIEQATHAAGMALLLLFILWVTYKDILRLF